MTSGQFLQRKFQAWALRKGIPLQGSAGDRGEPNYTWSPEENIFGGQFHPSVREAFAESAGGELLGAIPTMSALHSSAALAVNLFQHWVAGGQSETVAALLAVPSRGIESVRFEDRFPVCGDSERRGFPKPPHLDLALRYSDGSRVGVECKLFEPYGRLDHQPLRPAYVDLDNAWRDIPACRTLAVELAAGHDGYRRLGASQLVKHILGLRFGAPTGEVRLIYLYCDAIGDEAAEHRQEIRRFEAAIAGDPVRFVPMTVQAFILRAVRMVREHHSEYVDYLAERYL